MSSSSSSSSHSKSLGRLLGRVAVVTGASSGIGEAIALTLAQEGANLVLGARRQDRLEQVAEAVHRIDSTIKVLVRTTDVSDRQLMHKLIHDAIKKFGQVDILINNAGCMYFTKMKNVHVEEWDRMVDVNCKGVLNGISGVLPHMLKNGSGHIVTISSDAARRVFPSLAVYCGSKAFVDATCEGLRRELVGTGIRVTNIQPGDVAATELLLNNTDDEAAAEVRVKLMAKPGPRVSPSKVLLREDVADAVLYALTAPEYVAVNEILIEPRDQA